MNDIVTYDNMGSADLWSGLFGSIEATNVAKQDAKARAAESNNIASAIWYSRERQTDSISSPVNDLLSGGLAAKLNRTSVFIWIAVGIGIVLLVGGLIYFKRKKSAPAS